MNSNLSDIVKLDPLLAAPLLLGWKICRQTAKGLIKFKIVETEAYRQDDPASHSYIGKTTRTEPMFMAGGRLYIYFTYGMHYCINIVTGPQGVGQAVLIRAAEPAEGIGIIKENRGVDSIYGLANGPGKLAQALAINSTDLSGKILGRSSIWLEAPDKEVGPGEIISTPRIGIRLAKLQPWRFYIKNNPFVSKMSSKAVHKRTKLLTTSKRSNSLRVRILHKNVRNTQPGASF